MARYIKAVSPRTGYHMSQETKLFTWRQLKNSELVDKRLVRQIWLSSAVLLWEEFLSAAWPIGFLVGLFITVSLFGFWVWAPGWPHSIILFLFIFGFLMIATQAKAGSWSYESPGTSLLWNPYEGSWNYDDCEGMSN